MSRKRECSSIGRAPVSKTGEEGSNPSSPAINDPIERIVADTLDAAGIPYQRPDSGLDFWIASWGMYVAVECKQFYSERAVRQLEGRDNVILIQVRRAAEGFATMFRAAVAEQRRKDAEIARKEGELLRANNISGWSHCAAIAAAIEQQQG